MFHTRHHVEMIVNDHERIVAVGLLTVQDLHRLGPTFDRAYPIDETPVFSDLLREIDAAETRRRREADPA